MTETNQEKLERMKALRAQQANNGQETGPANSIQGNVNSINTSNDIPISDQVNKNDGVTTPAENMPQNGEDLKAFDQNSSPLINTHQQLEEGKQDILEAAFGTAIEHPLPEIIGETSLEERNRAYAEAQEKMLANAPQGYYTHYAGSIFGERGLVQLRVTPYGNFQSFEDAKRSKSVDTWKDMLELNQAWTVGTAPEDKEE